MKKYTELTIEELAEKAATKNNYVRKVLEEIIQGIEKIDAGQTIYIPLHVTIRESDELMIATGKRDLYVKDSGYGNIHEWSTARLASESLPIPKIKKILFNMPSALEELTKELVKISNYKIPEELLPFFKED